MEYFLKVQEEKKNSFFNYAKNSKNFDNIVSDSFTILNLQGIKETHCRCPYYTYENVEKASTILMLGLLPRVTISPFGVCYVTPVPRSMDEFDIVLAQWYQEGFIEISGGRLVVSVQNGIIQDFLQLSKAVHYDVKQLLLFLKVMKEEGVF